MMKLAILGVSGSIGEQVLKIVQDHQKDFEVVAVSVNTSIEVLDELIKRFPSIKMIGVSDLKSYNKILNKFDNIIVTNNLLDLVNYDEVTMVVNAIVGIAGLKPTLATIKANKDLALANKESIVCGGELIKELLKNSKTKIYPIDSEHSAIAQCLVGEDISKVKRLIITASGGPFRDLSLADLENVTKKDALNHPNWKMGNKITIDSATLVNKGLEIIEAHYLFSLPYNKIDTVIHYESIIHSMVEFIDGSIKAQMGKPNMEVPIQYALYKCKRAINLDQKFDLSKCFSLRFKPIDYDRFKAIKLAYDVGNKGGSAPLVYNASNEAAVDLFLKDLIAFKDIVNLIELALSKFDGCVVKDVEDVFSLDLKVRNFIYEQI